MSEKQFDHIDDRIREAAENSEPDFDENAWKLMEARLDKENDNKFRFLMWGFACLLLLITGGSVYVFFGKNQGSPQQQEAPVAGKIGKEPGETNKGAMHPGEEQEKAAQQATEQSLIPGNQQLPTSRAVTQENAGQPSAAAPDTVMMSKRVSSGKLARNLQKGRVTAKSQAPNVVDETTGDDQMPSSDKEPVKSVEKYSDAVIVPTNDTLVAVNKPAADADIKNDKSADSISAKNNKITANNKSKKYNEKLSRFYLLASLGADVASVKFMSFKNSEVAPKYGLGFGYQVNKKLSLQTGFYASWKKYIAGPYDYKTKPGSYWSMVDMIKVDASCLVYDIPVTLRYNFIQKPSTIYYATAGLSSFIIKEEDYDYHYKHNNTYYKSSKIYTGNKALLSVVNLSAGIEKKMGAAFSIQAEPSISIPLGGVGDGSVKLYSAAVQIGVKYQPSKKKK